MFVADTEFEFALLGPEHDGLTVHATDHVERGLGFAAQGQFQEVFLDAGLDGFAQDRLDLKEAIRRADAFNALVRSLVVVILNPEFDPLAGGVETVELGAGQKLLPDAFPEPLDLAQSHGMLRAALEVGYPVLLEFGLEPAGAAPGRVLAAIVGEHLLGRRELSRRHAIDFDHGLRCGAAEQIRTHQEARVIIQEGDQIGVTTSESEGEDVRLPHLIGRGPLEETGPGDVALPGCRCRWHQLGPMQMLAHRLGAGRQEEPAAQQLADAFDAEGRMLLLEFDDLSCDRLRQPGFSFCARCGLQSHFTELLIKTDPAAEAAHGHTHLLANVRQTEAFFEPQPNGLEPDFRRITAGRFFRAANPPRGVEGLPLPSLLYYGFFTHGNTPLNIGVSTIFPFTLVS